MTVRGMQILCEVCKTWYWDDAPCVWCMQRKIEELEIENKRLKEQVEDLNMQRNFDRYG